MKKFNIHEIQQHIGTLMSLRDVAVSEATDEQIDLFLEAKPTMVS